MRRQNVYFMVIRCTSKTAKTAKYQAKTVRLDKMSRRDEVSQDKKLRLDKMSKQGSRQEGVKL